MKLIKQSHEVISFPDNMLENIERAARTCYKSGDKVKSGSAGRLVKNLINKGHDAMLEFSGDIVVKFKTNRGVSHELVRHRHASYAQESTRYCNYKKDDIEFILPVWCDLKCKEYVFYVPPVETEDGSFPEYSDQVFIKSCLSSEEDYNEVIEYGWTPEKAREVLPNALATEINVSCNLREWRHIINLRCSDKAHPQIRGLMKELLIDFHYRVDIVFDDLYKKYVDKH